MPKAPPFEKADADDKPVRSEKERMKKREKNKAKRERHQKAKAMGKEKT